MAEVRNAISQALADGRYLLLDCSNGPLTGNLDINGNLRLFAGKNLDCKSLGAYFKPRRVRQSGTGPGMPTPDADEMLMWSDSDDDSVYLVYEDADGGTMCVQLT